MREFLDTEFDEDGKTIELISIALVAEDGREFYACNTEVDLTRVNPWVRDNVLPHLPPIGAPAWMTRAQIRDGVLAHIAAGVTKPEFWAYYADYDWVALCQLFGRMIDLPKGWPMFCRDLKQLSVDVGSPPHPPDPKDAHDALADARWNRNLYAFLMTIRKGKRHVDAADAWAVERQRILRLGRAFLERRFDSAFSTAHLANFLDALERGDV